MIKTTFASSTIINAEKVAEVPSDTLHNKVASLNGILDVIESLTASINEKILGENAAKQEVGDYDNINDIVDDTLDTARSVRDILERITTFLR